MSSVSEQIVSSGLTLRVISPYKFKQIVSICLSSTDREFLLSYTYLAILLLPFYMGAVFLTLPFHSYRGCLSYTPFLFVQGLPLLLLESMAYLLYSYHSISSFSLPTYIGFLTLLILLLSNLYSNIYSK